MAKKKSESSKTKVAKVNKDRGDTFAIQPQATTPRKSAEIKKAMNGFVVSSWDGPKERLYIAKTQPEAQKYAADCLKIK